MQPTHTVRLSRLNCTLRPRGLLSCSFTLNCSPLCWVCEEDERIRLVHADGNYKLYSYRAGVDADASVQAHPLYRQIFVSAETLNKARIVIDKARNTVFLCILVLKQQNVHDDELPCQDVNLRAAAKASRKGLLYFTCDHVQLPLGGSCLKCWVSSWLLVVMALSSLPSTSVASMNHTPCTLLWNCILQSI